MTANTEIAHPAGFLQPLYADRVSAAWRAMRASRDAYCTELANAAALAARALWPDAETLIYGHDTGEDGCTDLLYVLAAHQARPLWASPNHAGISPSGGPAASAATLESDTALTLTIPVQDLLAADAAFLPAYNGPVGFFSAGIQLSISTAISAAAGQADTAAQTALTGADWTAGRARAAVAELLALPHGQTAAGLLLTAFKDAETARAGKQIDAAIIEALEDAGIDLATVAGVMFYPYPYDHGHMFNDDAAIYFRNGDIKERDLFALVGEHLHTCYGIVGEDAGFYFIPATGDSGFCDINADTEMPAAIRDATGAATPEQFKLAQLAAAATSDLAVLARLSPSVLATAGVVFAAKIGLPPDGNTIIGTVYLTDTVCAYTFGPIVTDLISWLARKNWGEFPGVAINCATGTAELGSFDTAQFAQWLATASAESASITA